MFPILPFAAGGFRRILVCAFQMSLFSIEVFLPVAAAGNHEAPDAALSLLLGPNPLDQSRRCKRKITVHILIRGVLAVSLLSSDQIITVVPL